MPEQRSRPRDGRVIALANQKGGTGKTTTTVNLGIGLARLGKKVLLIDADPQGDLTTCLGWQDQDSLPTTLSTVMEKVIRDEPFTTDEGILHHSEGVDLMPANIELSALEMSLVNAMSREFTLRTYINEAKKHYDVVLIDCMPSLGMITINALAAADSVIVPVQAHYLPAKGMTQLMKTINKVKRQINPTLKVDGVLLTLVDGRTNLARQTADTLRQSYGSVLKIYRSEIPVAIKAAEISAAGNPLAADDPNGKVAVCARNVFRIWEQTKEKRSAQLVFCDLSTPTTDGSFSVYDDLKKKLMDAGIPEEEIAFIHTADSEAKKKELFSKVRAGQVRVLLGSTAKMGAGTNVQDRLIALHDLDCPWRPSDDGRTLRTHTKAEAPAWVSPLFQGRM